MKRNFTFPIVFLWIALLLCGCTVHLVSNTDATTEPEVQPMQQTTLRFDSFDGGGPTFTAIPEDPTIVLILESVDYGKANHAELDGASFTVTFTFTGLQPGTTGLTIEERSPIAGNYDHTYQVTVAQDLSVTVEALSVIDLDAPEPIEPVPTLVIEIGNQALYAVPESNASAEEFVALLSQEPIAVELRENGGLEKVGALPWELPCDGETCAAAPGDVILYPDNRLAICYGENAGDFTRLAQIGSVTEEALLEALGPGDAAVVLWIEWSE